MFSMQGKVDIGIELEMQSKGAVCSIHTRLKIIGGTCV